VAWVAYEMYLKVNQVMSFCALHISAAQILDNDSICMAHADSSM